MFVFEPPVRFDACLSDRASFLEFPANVARGGTLYLFGPGTRDCLELGFGGRFGHVFRRSELRCSYLRLQACVWTEQGGKTRYGFGMFILLPVCVEDDVLGDGGQDWPGGDGPFGNRQGCAARGNCEVGLESPKALGPKGREVKAECKGKGKRKSRTRGRGKGKGHEPGKPKTILHEGNAGAFSNLSSCSRLVSLSSCRALP